ncbi:MAG: DM13 domain-containing protein [Planctomycetota bacterium]
MTRRTSLRSALPLLAAVAATSMLAACGSSSSTMVEGAVAGQTVATGSFSGRNDHIVTGSVSIIRDGSDHFVVLADDFSLDGAPDPKIGFGTSGAYDDATTFTALRNKTGAQTYAVPAGIDPTQYNEVYIWCEQFAVALGVAPI